MAAPSTSPEESTGTFRVINKLISRASIVALKMGELADGSPNIVNQPGPRTTHQVGEELTDLTETELRAFPDRFEAVDEQARKTMQKVRGMSEEPPKDNAGKEVEPGPFVPGAPNSPQDQDVPPQPLGETAAQQSVRQRSVPTVAGGRAQPSRQGEQAPAPQREAVVAAAESQRDTPVRPGEPPASSAPPPREGGTQVTAPPPRPPTPPVPTPPPGEPHPPGEPPFPPGEPPPPPGATTRRRP